MAAWSGPTTAVAAWSGPTTAVANQREKTHNCNGMYGVITQRQDALGNLKFSLQHS
jgi:hypothetical protein